VNDRRCECGDLLDTEEGADGGNMMASAGNRFSASSPSRCLFKVPGVEMSAAGSRLPTGRNGALSRINGVVEVGGGICNDIGRVTGVEAGSMEMTLFRLVSLGP